MGASVGLRDDYAAGVDAVRAAIARGDVYQVNLVQHLLGAVRGRSRGAPGAARAVAAACTAGPSRATAGRSSRPRRSSSSPGAATGCVTMPIKGTRPAGEDVDDAKDAAEHVMIVDLERNDLSRVCIPGHGALARADGAARAGRGHAPRLDRRGAGSRPDAGLAEILAALHPGGSITGAPKISAIDHIARIEPVGRGASMGALGTVWPNGDFELALTIRTFAVAAGRVHLWAGGGIVWDSDAEAEIEESWVKARPLLAAVGGLVRA